MNKAKLMDNLQKVIDESSEQISVNNIAAWKYLNEAHDQLECSKAISDEMNEENDDEALKILSSQLANAYHLHKKYRRKAAEAIEREEWHAKHRLKAEHILNYLKNKRD